MKEKNVHYYPGHMRKAESQLSSYVKLVDLIVEVVDARAPMASQNPTLSSLFSGKKRILLLSKSDWADPEVTKKWLEHFQKEGTAATAGNLKEGKIVNLLKQCSAPLIAEKRAKEQKLGMKSQPLRLMVVGVPNVGKSTFINAFKGKGKAKVGNIAGYTRSEQWIRVSPEFLLLDTPGILPMNYADGRKAVILALLGTMRENVLPTEDLADALYGYLKERYPDALQKRFGIAGIRETPFDEALSFIANKRGLLEGGVPSPSRAAYLLFKEFKDGLLGPYSLEEPNA